MVMKSSSHSRRPLKDLNQKQKQINPFSKSSNIHTGKISRPGLDAAFVYHKSKRSASANVHGNDKGKEFGNGGNTTVSTNANTDTDISINNDADSSSEMYMNMYERESSIVSYSELDMSIGARAAIYEQSRHVAKYGLDGDGHGNGNDDGVSPSKNINSHLNDEWDRIMDGANMSQASFSSTFIAEQSFSNLNSHSAVNNSNSSFLKGYNGNVSSTLDENMPLDMSGIDGCAANNNNDTTTSDYLNVTCDQSDFFNSSRVANLRTPEKNKAKVDAASRQARMRMLGVEIDHEHEDEHDNGPNRREKGTGSGGGAATDLGTVASSVINGVSSFPSLMMDRLQKSYSHSVSGSASGVGVNDSSASGMIGLFNAALRMGDGLDMNDQSHITRDDDEDHHHHHNKSSSMQNDETASFISYQEPNLSVVHDSSFKVPTIHDNDDDNNGNDNDDDNHHHHHHEVGSSFGYIGGDDSGIAQESFISYREPDLSLVSNHSSNNRSYGHGHGHGHDDGQAHSDFNVDVSEIIAPNELEHKLGGINSHANASASTRAIPASPEHAKGSSPRPLYSPCSTPVRLSNNSISASPGGKSLRSTPGASRGWPPLSPHGRHHHQQRQSKNSTGANMNTIHTRGPNSDKRQQTSPQKSPTFGTDALELKANVSLLSPIENKQRQHQRYSDSREVQTPIQIEPATPQVLSSLSSHSHSRSMRYASREESRFESSRVSSKRQNQHQQQQQQDENSNKQLLLPQSVPRKISLRERYTRADRFLNDDFTIPSSASTLEESSPQTLESLTPQQTYEESPVNRSLLDTFDKSTAKRRFEI